LHAVEHYAGLGLVGAEVEAAAVQRSGIKGLPK